MKAAAHQVMLTLPLSPMKKPWSLSLSSTAVKCQDVTSGTEEGCVGATPKMTPHCNSPYGRSPVCVSVIVCWGLSLCAMEQPDLIPSYSSMIAAVTNRCVQWNEMKFGDALIGKLKR